MKKTIVFDTNVVVSAALLSRSTVRFIFDKARLSYQLCMSDACFQELSEVIMRPKFRKYLSVDNAQAFLDELKQKVSFVPITHTVNDCRDPKDNKFLELALSSSAQYLITGDPDLLVLNPYYNIQILTPTQFLETAF